MKLRRAVLAGLVLAATTATAAQAAPELSTSDRLADRRYVAASERAQIEGFQDGRFYANGWHITGEMGGIWTPPLKLVDGVWFGIDDQWVGPAQEFTSGYGYTRFKLPDTAGIQVERTDFAPDGPPRRAVPASSSPTRAPPAPSRSRSTRTPSCSRAIRGASTAPSRTRASSSPTPAASTATRSSSATRASSRTRTPRRTTTRRSWAPR